MRMKKDKCLLIKSREYFLKGKIASGYIESDFVRQN